MTHINRPRIGIPVRLLADDGSDPRVEAAARVFESIVSLVEETGSEAVRVEPGPGFADQLAACDGFVLPGGGDVSPALYRGPVDHPTLFGVDEDQDTLDAEVIRHALSSDRPLLGVCRGMQLLNVVAGGSLIVHLEDNDRTHLAEIVTGDETVEHAVAIHPATRYARAFAGQSTLPVRSSHHQAVERLGDGLVISASSEDGLIEAVESDDESRWVLGIQWHPEMAHDSDPFRTAPFEALREAAEARKARS